MRKKLFNLFLLCGILYTVTSCTEEEKTMGQAMPLTMDIKVKENGTRAVIENGTLPDGTFVGVTVVDEGGSTYNNISYSNLKATVSGTVLNLDSEVMITDTDATIYGYYPWADGVSETAVPLSAGDTDYLYATPIMGVDNGDASATLFMDHALACLRVSVSRGCYSGTGALTTLSITSDALSTTGTLNARTGVVTATGSNVYETTLSQTIGDAAVTKDIMVIPTGTAGNITFSILVDGNEYFVTDSNVTLEKGGMYEFDLTIESLTWDNAPDGVYAVAADGSPVTYADADESCIAVALVAGEHQFWIEKNEASNTSYATANDSYESSDDCDYYFSWGGDGTDQADIPTYNQVGGNSSSWTWGYLPKADGSYSSTSNNLSSDITTWTDGTALGDFNGKENSKSIKNILNNGSGYNYYTPMGVLLNTFNEFSNTENFGYTDWYIPALGQLALMWLNMAEINTALTAIGGTTISSDNYWSSSEYSSNNGWYVYFYDGIVYGNNKYRSFRVRLVRDF